MRAEWVVLGVWVVYFRHLFSLTPIMRNSVIEELRVRRFATIHVHEENCCRAFWKWAGLQGFSVENVGRVTGESTCIILISSPGVESFCSESDICHVPTRKPTGEVSRKLSFGPSKRLKWSWIEGFLKSPFRIQNFMAVISSQRASKLLLFQYKKAQLSLTNPCDAKACRKLLQFDVLTTLSACRWQYWPIFIRLAVVASKICEIARNSLKIQTYGVQRHPRSSILVSIESPCTTSY